MCWHRWPLWSKPESFILPNAEIDSKGLIACGYKQERTCEKCGKTEIRKL